MRSWASKIRCHGVRAIRCNCFLLVILSMGFVHTQDFQKSKSDDFPDLLAPLEVLVDETTSNSVTLTWKSPPNPLNPNVKLFTYSLILTPLTDRGNGLEKEYSLPPSITTKQVNGLLEGTRYVVQLSAVYGDPNKRPSRDRLQRVSAPKFTVVTPVAFQQDVPVGDNGIAIDVPACNCSDTGTVACVQKPGYVGCTCHPGYSGTWCEECAPGNFRAGKECQLCPCTNVTSSAECTMSRQRRIQCTKCLPGHNGDLCTLCKAGYHRKSDQDRCLPLNCLSNSLCAEQRDAPGCEDCIFLEDRFPATAHRSNSERGIADGTLPLIAVVVTLGVLLLVAAMATCYRYWNHRRHQPRIPFWSIELQDDKSDLHTHCQYQHLDAATNKVVHAAPEDIAATSGGGGLGSFASNEGGRLTMDTLPRTYNTINV